jgi:hypothetical protein
MSDRTAVQPITSGGTLRKNVPVVTVQSFFEAHAEKLQLKLEGERVGFPPQDPRAHHQSTGPRALGVLQIFR